MKMTAKEMETVMTLIGKADNEQLSEIIARVKLQRTWLANQMVRSIVIGDTVEFDARGRVARGEVTKVNRKNINVREQMPNGMATNWKVPASMLKKVA